MKNNIIILATVLLSFLLTIGCSKTDNDEVPKDNPSGEYSYTSNSVYYNADMSEDKRIESFGDMHIEIATDMEIMVYPNIGYSYTLSATNLNIIGDTTTFSIGVQEITIKGKDYKVVGTNDVTVGTLGDFDGYFTDKIIVLKYKSTDIVEYTIVKTKIEAQKKN